MEDKTLQNIEIQILNSCVVHTLGYRLETLAITEKYLKKIRLLKEK